MPPNGSPNQTTPGTVQGRRGKSTATEATPPRRPHSAAAARLAATEGLTPTCTGECVVNNDMCLSSRRGGKAPWGGALTGRKSGESERKAHRKPMGWRGACNSAGGGGGSPSAKTQQGNVCAGGGRTLHGGRRGNAGLCPYEGAPFFQEVYGDFPHHSEGTNKRGGIPDDATWQSCWRRIAAQSAS